VTGGLVAVDQAPASGRTGAHRGADVLLAVAVAVEVAFVLAGPRLPTVDGPAHLLGATVLSAPGSAPYDEFYRVHVFPSPNLSTELVLAGLLRVFSPGVAERLLVAAYVVLLPLGLRYAVRSVRPGSEWLALAAVPLTFGYLFFYGFYNYCVGLALFCFCVGYALRRLARADRPGLGGPRATAGLAGLLTLTYFTHLTAFAMAVLAVGAIAIVAAKRRQPMIVKTSGRYSARSLPDHEKGDATARGTPVVRRRPREASRALVPVGLAAAPGVILAAVFTLLNRGNPQPPQFVSPLGLLAGLVTLHTPVVTFDRLELIGSVLVAATLFGLGVAALRSRPRPAAARAPAVAAALALAAFLLAPNRFGAEYGFVNERLSVFPVLLGVCWLAAHRFGPRARTLAAAAFLLAAVVLGVVRAPALAHYERLATEFASVQRVIEPSSTLLSVRFAAQPPPGGEVRNPWWDPLLHMASRVAVDTHGVDIGHYEARLAYFPTQFRASHDLRRLVDPTGRGLEAVPPRIDLGAAVSEDRPTVDYVLLVSPAAADTADPPTARLLDVLSSDFRRVMTTEPTGLVEVWARRGVPTTGAGAAMISEATTAWQHTTSRP